MIRPMDIQVNLNAIPEYARMNVVEQSGELFRHVRDMGEARLENLNRNENVPATEPTAEANLHRLEQLIDHPAAPSGQRKSRRLKERTAQLDELYEPGKGRPPLRHARFDESAGDQLDFTA